jgi:hypothetical protein
LISNYFQVGPAATVSEEGLMVTDRHRLLGLHRVKVKLLRVMRESFQLLAGY